MMMINKNSKILCLCTSGLNRSPTIANILYKLYDINARAVGVHPDHSLILVSDKLIEWSDKIIVAHEEIYYYLEIDDNHRNKLITLDIEDIYEWNDPELISKIKYEINKFYR